MAPGPDRLHVVPLAFAALAVVAGYALGRGARLAYPYRSGARRRIILIRSHWERERAAWDQARAPYNVGYPYSGGEPVAVITRP